MNCFRNVVLTTVLLVVFGGTQAQQMLGQRSEVGFGLGTFNYTGDLVRSYNLAFSKPAAKL
jgi:hypothetical protein